MLIFMMKKPIKINDALIKWYQYKCSEHNKLKKGFKRENSNESRLLAGFQGGCCINAKLQSSESSFFKEEVILI